MGPAHSGQTLTWAQTVGLRAGRGRGEGDWLVEEGEEQGMGESCFGVYSVSTEHRRPPSSCQTGGVGSYSGRSPKRFVVRQPSTSENAYRPCYIRGPEGLLLGLAEPLG